MSGTPPGIDLERLLPWFQANVAPVDELSAELIGHGRSNLTYRVSGGGEHWVLRRPPLSHVQPTAHDMKREFRVISALKGTDVPVPEAIAVCEDAEVNGAPFYVMEYVEGLVPIDSAEVARRFDEGQRRRIGEELVDVLVRLHSIRPGDVGLEDFGRPQGYIERQVRRFTEQLERAKTRKLPELEELARRLAAAMPREGGAGIVHGDYRLDNAILSDDGHIVAVLDWEMATLGDPLADVGILRMYWPDRDAESISLPVGGSVVMTLPGFPTWDEAVERYQRRTGYDLTNLDFYVVLAHFKLAVILENMHARYLAGTALGAGFEGFGEHIGEFSLSLTRRGLAIADGSAMADLRG